MVASIKSDTCTVDAAPSATVPDNVPPAVKLIAPADDAPVPETVNGSAEVTAAPTSRVAPDCTVVPVPVSPSDDVAVIFKVPADTVVAPV